MEATRSEQPLACYGRLALSASLWWSESLPRPPSGWLRRRRSTPYWRLASASSRIRELQSHHPLPESDSLARRRTPRCRRRRCLSQWSGRNRSSRTFRSCELPRRYTLWRRRASKCGPARRFPPEPAPTWTAERTSSLRSPLDRCWLKIVIIIAQNGQKSNIYVDRWLALTCNEC